jgi:gluconolactonase
VAQDATITELARGFEFAEGPASNAAGDVYFSDLKTSKTHKCATDGKLSTHRTDSGGANGLFFDADGSLIACEGDRGRLVSIDPRGQVTVLAAEYQGKRFNKPNDLWIAPSGGIYFSDPAYGTRPTQDGENVYYLAPDRKRVVCAIDDLVRPNGLVGTPDGKTLYVSDHGSRKIYAYDIGPDGSLSNKRFFAPVGADGMCMDSEGNVYLAEDAVLVYSPSGERIATIEVPEQPTNLCFGGKDGHILFITTRPALYSIQMRLAGATKSRQRQRE